MNKYIKYIVVILGILLFIAREGCNRSKIEKLQSENTLISLNKQRLEGEKNLLNQEIVKQKAIIVSDDKVLKEYTDSIFKLKKKSEKDVKSVTAYYQQIIKTIPKDTIRIPYTDTVYNIPNIDSTEQVKVYLNNSIPVPLKFSVDSPNYKIEGVVKKKGIDISTLSLTDTLHFRIVESKKNIFSRKQIEFQAYHTNPLFNVEKSQSVYYTPKKNPLPKIALVAAGVLLGILIK